MKTWSSLSMLSLCLSRTRLSTCSFLYLLSFVLCTWTVYHFVNDFTPSVIHVAKIYPGSYTSPREVAYGDAIHAIYQPMRKRVTDASFKDPIDDKVYDIPSQQFIWKEGLGHNLCIIDVDSRGLDEEDQLLHPRFDFSKLQGVSAGMINHYIYAKIHGYDYKFIHTSKWPNKTRDEPWPKVPALREMLRSYRMVIMMDADAIFRHPELPIEWLLNRWNFTGETSMAMALDVGEYIDAEGKKQHYGATLNKYGDLNPNAGFVIAQNLPRTFEMLDAWVSCPDNEAEFSGCDRFRRGWPAEQGAFGEHITYKFNRSTDFLPIACDDGMGFPGQGYGCEGKFVTHYTTAKHVVREATVNSLLQGMLLRAYDDFIDPSSDTRQNRLATDGLEEKYW